ncbi:MAG: response regulator [Woeseia sp.]|nr:response regulator [Woeseia sp.]NNL54243.1 response regulator [Woeseia sp.]
MESNSRTENNKNASGITTTRSPVDDRTAEVGGKDRAIRVLVVEDHRALRASLAMFLEFHGYVVTASASFDEALQAAAATKPDVAVCDRHLNEDRDGIDVARELQRQFGCRLVFVSGTAMDDLRAATKDLDVVAYISKPALPDRIEAAVRKAKVAG